MVRRRWRLLLSVLLLTLVLACGGGPPIPTAAPLATATTPAGPGSSPVPTLYPSPTPLPPDTGWQRVQPGMEIRGLDVAAGQTTERVTIVRLNPDSVRFEVHYALQAAYPVSVWAGQTGALLVANGGYFTPELAVTGLTIAQGERFGTPLPDYAGMLAVTSDDRVSVRWLRSWPYDPGEPLREAIQSFPVLVKPGGVMGFPADADDGRPSRRTVVAQDRQGRILLLVAARGYLSLNELAVWLADSDLDIDVALNLDGGTSSGLWMADGPQIDSLTAVPAVVAVFAR